MRSDIHRTTGLLISLLIASCIGLVILRKSESFLASPGSGRCGIQLGGCDGPDMKCMNGYCESNIPPKQPETSGLPVYP
jgi:hypothetical protein